LTCQSANKGNIHSSTVISLATSLNTMLEWRQQLYALLIFQLDRVEQLNYTHGESTVVHDGYMDGEA
jgi:hypothetical protein